MDHTCKNNPDRLCYIFGNVFLRNSQAKITVFVKKAYSDYFGVKLRDVDNPFATQVAVEVERLEEW